MSEEEYFANRSGDDTNKLLREYHRAFHKGYFDIEETGVNLTDAELRADVLHCLYRNRPKEQNDQPGPELVRLAAV